MVWPSQVTVTGCVVASEPSQVVLASVHGPPVSGSMSDSTSGLSSSSNTMRISGAPTLPAVTIGGCSASSGQNCTTENSGAPTKVGFFGSLTAQNVASSSGSPPSPGMNAESVMSPSVLMIT